MRRKECLFGEGRCAETVLVGGQDQPVRKRAEDFERSDDTRDEMEFGE